MDIEASPQSVRIDLGDTVTVPSTQTALTLDTTAGATSTTYNSGTSPYYFSAKSATAFNGYCFQLNDVSIGTPSGDANKITRLTITSSKWASNSGIFVHVNSSCANYVGHNTTETYSYMLAPDILSSTSDRHRQYIVVFKKGITPKAAENFLRTAVYFVVGNGSSKPNKATIMNSGATISVQADWAYSSDSTGDSLSVSKYVSNSVSGDSHEHFYECYNHTNPNNAEDQTNFLTAVQDYNYCKTFYLDGCRGYQVTPTSMDEFYLIGYALNTVLGTTVAQRFGSCNTGLGFATIQNPDAATFAGLSATVTPGSGFANIGTGLKYFCGPEANTPINSYMNITSSNRTDIWWDGGGSWFATGAGWQGASTRHKLDDDDNATGTCYPRAATIVEFSGYNRSVSSTGTAILSLVANANAGTYDNIETVPVHLGTELQIPTSPQSLAIDTTMGTNTTSYNSSSSPYYFSTKATTSFNGYYFKLANPDLGTAQTTDNKITRLTVSSTKWAANSGIFIHVADSCPSYTGAYGTEDYSYMLSPDILSNSSSRHTRYIIVFRKGISPEAAENFIEQAVYFIVGNGSSKPTNDTIMSSGATVRIQADWAFSSDMTSDSLGTAKYVSNIQTGDSHEHFYEFYNHLNDTSNYQSCPQAYNFSKNVYLDGCRGYEPTLTSLDEFYLTGYMLNAVLGTSISNRDGSVNIALGYMNLVSPDASSWEALKPTNVGAATYSSVFGNFKWFCGPEAGMTVSSTVTSDVTYSSVVWNCGEGKGSTMGAGWQGASTRHKLDDDENVYGTAFARAATIVEFSGYNRVVSASGNATLQLPTASDAATAYQNAELVPISLGSTILVPDNPQNLTVDTTVGTITTTYDKNNSPYYFSTATTTTINGYYFQLDNVSINTPSTTSNKITRLTVDTSHWATDDGIFVHVADSCNAFGTETYSYFLSPDILDSNSDRHTRYTIVFRKAITPAAAQNFIASAVYFILDDGQVKPLPSAIQNSSGSISIQVDWAASSDTVSADINTSKYNEQVLAGDTHEHFYELFNDTAREAPTSYDYCKSLYLDGCRGYELIPTSLDEYYLAGYMLNTVLGTSIVNADGSASVGIGHDNISTPDASTFAGLGLSSLGGAGSSSAYLFPDYTWFCGPEAGLTVKDTCQPDVSYGTVVWNTDCKAVTYGIGWQSAATRHMLDDDYAPNSTEGGYYNRGSTIAEFSGYNRIVNATGTGVLNLVRTVTFKSVNGTLGTQNVYAGEDAVLDAWSTLNTTGEPTGGWIISGWTESGSGHTIDYQDGGVINTLEDLTLNAVYSRTVTLSYNGNDAPSGSLSDMTDSEYYNADGTFSSVNFILAPNAFSNPGYSFMNWEIDNDSSISLNPNDTVVFTSSALADSPSHTATAIWSYDAVATGITEEKQQIPWVPIVIAAAGISIAGTVALRRRFVSVKIWNVRRNLRRFK